MIEPLEHRFIESLESRVMLALTVQYFENMDFTGWRSTLPDSEINHPNPWGTPTGSGITDAKQFSARWTGRVRPQYSETYTFHTSSNDGIRLWVDNKLIIDNWRNMIYGFPNETDRTSIPVALTAGKDHDIRVDYFNDDLADTGVSDFIKLEWSSPSQARQIVPAARLFTPQQGLTGHYYDDKDFTNSKLKVTKVDATVDKSWSGVPDPAFTDGNTFSVRWTGQVLPNHTSGSGTYTFYTDSDDGVRLWVNGKRLIDNWTVHSPTENSGTIVLEAGKRYDVRMEYFDETGGAVARLKWSRGAIGGSPAVSKQVIPSSQLFAATAPLSFPALALKTKADPWITTWDGQYVNARSEGGRLWVAKSDSLGNLATAPETMVFDPETATPGYDGDDNDLWAPALHYLDHDANPGTPRKWYLYFAADSDANNHHRMHVLESTTQDPAGPYVSKGKINVTTDEWAIDPAVVEWGGQMYLMWSGWPESNPPYEYQQRLYIARMSNPWTLATDRVQISTPTYNWEKWEPGNPDGSGSWQGSGVNEAPRPLIHNGKLHIIYSASRFTSDEYSLGQLTLTGSDILNPVSWTKKSTPVFTKSTQVHGPAQAMFFKSLGGLEDWMVFVAHDGTSEVGDRDLYLQEFGWNPDDSPNFGAPLAPGTLIDEPAGR